MTVPANINISAIQSIAQTGHDALEWLLSSHKYKEVTPSILKRLVTGQTKKRIYKGVTLTSDQVTMIKDEQNARDFMSTYYHNIADQRITTIFVLSGIIFTLFIGYAVKTTFQHEKIEVFVEHFTNWAWMIHTTFYIVLWMSVTLLYQTKLMYYVLGLCITSIAGIATTVAALVLINIALLEQYWLPTHGSTSDSTYVTVSYFLDTFSSFNPESSQPFDVNTTVWSVLFGSELYHTFPVIFWMLVVIFFDAQLSEAFSRLYSGYNKLATLVIRLILTFFPCAIMLSYLIFYNPLAVYHAKGPLYPAIILGIGICGLTNYFLLRKYFPYPVPRHFYQKYIHQHSDPLLSMFFDDNKQIPEKTFNVSVRKEKRIKNF